MMYDTLRLEKEKLIKLIKDANIELNILEQKIKKQLNRQQQLEPIVLEREAYEDLTLKHKYKYDKDKGTVMFAGVKLNGEMILGLAKCSKQDQFELEIGKSLAVAKAFNASKEHILSLVQPK